MTRTEIEEKVRNFLIEDLEIEEDKITPNAKLKDDMGIDSLKVEGRLKGPEYVDAVTRYYRALLDGKDREMSNLCPATDSCSYMT